MQEALRTGRLRKSSRRVDGVWRIDTKAADKEWASSTQSDRAPLTGRTAPRGLRQEQDAGEEEGSGLSLVEESAREKHWKANLAEFECRERAGELMDRKETAHKLAALAAMLRTDLLALPPSIKQELPHLTVSDIGRIDALIRSALEKFASQLATAAAEKEAEADVA